GDLDPGYGGCTETDVPGPDAFVPVELAPNDLLTVDDVAGQSLYVVGDCTDPTSCKDAAPEETSSSGAQGIVYLNQTGGTETVYLVADGWNPAGGSYVFDLDVRPTSPLAAADTFGDLGTVAALTTGSHAFRGDLTNWSPDQGTSNNNSCTGYSADGQDAI